MKTKLKILIWRMILRAGAFFERCRVAYIKSCLEHCGEDVVIYPGASFSCPERISIGDHTHIGERVHLRGGGHLRIGKWCQFANHVIVSTSNHKIDGGLYAGHTTDEDVVIGDNVWFGSNAIVVPGVTIGDNAVIGAGAVVTKDIPANVVAAGVPARVLRQVPQKGAPDRTPAVSERKSN